MTSKIFFIFVTWVLVTPLIWASEAYVSEYLVESEVNSILPLRAEDVIQMYKKGIHFQKSRKHFSDLPATNLGVWYILDPQKVNASSDDVVVWFYDNLHSAKFYSVTDVESDRPVLDLVETRGALERDDDSYHPYVHISGDKLNAAELMLIRFKSHAPLRYNYTVMSKGDWSQKLSFQLLFLGFYIGTILCLSLYNVMIYLFTKYKLQYFYLGFAFSMVGFILISGGWVDRYIGGNSGWIILTPITRSLLAISMLLLINRFARASTRFVKAYIVSLIIMVLYGVLAMVSMVNGSKLYFDYVEFIDIPNIFYSLFMLLYCVKHKYEGARIFLFGWGGMLTAFLMFALGQSGLIDLMPSENLPLAGNLFEVVVISVMMSYRVKALSDVELRYVMSEREKKNIGQLLRVITHDIATPLSIVDLAVKLRSKDSPDERMWKKVEFGVGQIKSIADTVKDFIKVDKGSIDSNLKNVKIEDVLELIKSLYAERMAEKVIQFEVKSDEMGDVYIRGNENVLIHQIIGNLVSNSFKFTDEGGKVTICAYRKGADVIVEVSDNGVGMPSEDLHKIMDQDVTYSTAGTKGESGTGFGVGIMKSFVERFGGSVNVTSNTDPSKGPRGTTFTLKFPMV